MSGDSPTLRQIVVLKHQNIRGGVVFFQKTYGMIQSTD